MGDVSRQLTDPGHIGSSRGRNAAPLKTMGIDKESMLTPRTKEKLSFFGKSGVLTSVSTTIGILVTILAGTLYLKAQGQNILITPVIRDTIKTEVDEKVLAAKRECQSALANHIQNANEERQEMKKRIEKQDDVNGKILDKLMTIAEDVAEMKGRLK